MSDPPSRMLIFRRVPASVRRTSLERFAGVLRERVAGGREFECLITGDRELQRLNREFLGKDYPTDVLSFPAGEGSAQDFLGSLAISARRAAVQAREYGHSQEQELEILMLHGLLHLLGLDHETDRGRMARVEHGWRRRLSLPAGLIERARA